jgi:pimeloyl-ACP methyl ester carboxylesterase
MQTGDEIADCGHWLPLEQPSVVNAKILSFFQAIEECSG